MPAWFWSCWPAAQAPRKPRPPKPPGVRPADPEITGTETAVLTQAPNVPPPSTRKHATKEVMAPEIGCNLVDIGLIYGVAITGGRVKVAMTLTTPGCPMHESLCGGVQAALLNLAGVDDAEVELVWDPPWHPAMMTESGRTQAGVRNF